MGGLLRSSCLDILWALELSVEIVESGASHTQAFCVGFRHFSGPSLPRHLRLEVRRTTRLVRESGFSRLNTRGRPLAPARVIIKENRPQGQGEDLQLALCRPHPSFRNAGNGAGEMREHWTLFALYPCISLHPLTAKDGKFFLGSTLQPHVALSYSSGREELLGKT